MEQDNDCQDNITIKYDIIQFRQTDADMKTGAIFITAAALALAGCRQGSGDQGAARDGRLQYEAEKNEVEVMTLRRSVFTRQLIANGRLAASAKSALRFRGTGVIERVEAANGQTVRKGAVIAALDRTEKSLSLRSAELSLQKAEIELHDVLAGQGYTARDTSSVPPEVMRMARMRSGYDAALNSLRQAEYEYDGMVLRAPFSGKVADITLRRYDQSTSEAFCTLIDDSSLDVDFTVLESEYGFLEEGLEVDVTPFSGDGRRIRGRITGINPTVDRNGQVAVRARVENDGSLIDGMNVKVTVGKDVPGCLVVPKSTVVIRDNLEVLFRHRDGKALWTYVHTVMSSGDSYVVVPNTDRGAELSEGDEVIISGNLNLADGSTVTVRGMDN